MARINLLGGTYLARSVTADAQRCLNLYPEKNPADASAPFTNQLTPGLLYKRAASVAGVARGLYTATDGSLFYVCGTAVYFVDQNFNITQLGSLNSSLSTPVAMQDNGNVLVLVDGTTSGYAINLTPGIAGQPQGGQLTDAGSGGTNGTYADVPLSGGTGTGATAASITVAGGVITDFTLGNTGLGYLVGDTLSADTLLGTTGSAFKLSSVGAEINAFAEITDPNFLGSVGVGYVDTFFGFDQPGTRNFYTSLSNVTFAQLTGTPGQVSEGTIIAGGTGGTTGTFTNVPLLGGSGSGATGTLVISGGGAVTSLVLDPTGLGYNAGDVLTATGGPIGALNGFQYSVVNVNSPAFDPTYVAAKTGYPDLLATVVAVHREWWLMGAYQTTEVWYDAGNANFPFAIMPGVFIEHGCAAPYSVVTHDLIVFWLGIDEAGQGTIFQGAGYAARRISTYAIEKILSNWLAKGYILSDCIGMIYKQQDHVFVIFTFPTADGTLVYDLTEGLWHERAWTDPASGLLHRIRPNCMALAYGMNVAADWQNGNLYVIDLGTYTDNGGPITRRRGFPHLLNDGKLQSYDRLALDMDCGNGDAANPGVQQMITLEVSDDRGHTFWAAPPQSLGAQGQYLVQAIWHRLGIARDRVFRVTWSGSSFTAISGAWLDASPSEK